MRLILHLLVTDAKRFKWLLLLWLALELVATTMGAIQLGLASDLRTFHIVGALTNLLWLVELLLFFVFAPLVIQADPIVIQARADAFWMTRPIPPRTLLAAKAILLWIALVFVPIAIEFAVTAAFRMPLGDLLLTAAQNIIAQTFAVMILMAVASLTPTVSKFVLVWVTAVVGFVLTASAGQFARTTLGVEWPTFWKDTGDSTSSVLLMVLVIAAAVTTLSVQYRFRSLWRSIGWAVAGALVAVAIASQWGWPLIRPKKEVPEWAREVSSLQLLASSEAVRGELVDHFAGPLLDVTAGLRLGRLPAGWSAQVLLNGAKFDLADGSFLGEPGPIAHVRIDADDLVSGYAVARQLLGVERLDQAPSDKRGPVVLRAPIDQLGEFLHRSGRYNGTFSVVLTENAVEGAIRLKPGATWQRRGYRVIIDDASQENGTTSLLVREVTVQSVFSSELVKQRQYFLRNRIRSRAIPVSTTDWITSDTPIPRVMPFVLYREGASYTSSGVRRLFFDDSQHRNAEPIDAGWLADAELVTLVSTYRGSVDRTLIMDNFTIPEPTPSHPSR